MPSGKKNRKIVITNAAQAIATILEQHGLTVALTGEVAIFVLSGMIVPKVNKASIPQPHLTSLLYPLQ